MSGNRKQFEGPVIRWETGHPPHRTFGEWHEDPWAPPEDKARRRAARNRRWVASLTERDWVRLAALADTAATGRPTVRLDDLDAPIVVGVYPIDQSHGPNGARFGTLRGCVLMAWPKEHRPARR